MNYERKGKLQKREKNETPRLGFCMVQQVERYEEKRQGENKSQGVSMFVQYDRSTSFTAEHTCET